MMTGGVATILAFLPRALAQRLPLLMIVAYLFGAGVALWTAQGLYKRSFALAHAENSGEVLRELLSESVWQTLPAGGRTALGGFELQRHAKLSEALPPHSVPLILVIDDARLRAAITFHKPPKLPQALNTNSTQHSTTQRLAKLARGIVRQDQAAEIYIFLASEEVLTLSSPEYWRSRPSQTTVALIGLAAFALGLAVLVPLSFYLALPFARLAERGVIAEPVDALASTEAYLIKDKIHRLTERFRIEQETKERNLAAISHDLRTPVTRLRLRAELLQDEALHARFEADLDEVSSIIDGALDLLSLRSQPEDSFRFSLASLLDSLVSDYSDTGKKVEFISTDAVELQSAQSIFSTGQEVTVRTETSCMMHGQPDKLRRAFSNLIDNALKYGGRAIVEVKPVSKDMISVSIRDFGPGIDPDQIDRVQMPFVRGHIAQSSPGIGLGLSIAKELIDIHSGSLHFTNLEPGLLVTVLIARGS